MHVAPPALHADPAKRPQSTRAAAALFGLINSVVTLPVLIAYTAIVFQASPFTRRGCAQSGQTAQLCWQNALCSTASCPALRSHCCIRCVSRLTQSLCLHSAASPAADNVQRGQKGTKMTHGGRTMCTGLSCPCWPSCCFCPAPSTRPSSCCCPACPLPSARCCPAEFLHPPSACIGLLVSVLPLHANTVLLQAPTHDRDLLDPAELQLWM